MNLNNPILKSLKEDDIVMIEVPSRQRASYLQICRIYNLKYSPADSKHNYDWLDFDAEVLYVNYRVHKSVSNQCIGNCLAIREIIPKELIETYTRQYDMWKPEMYPMSDLELEFLKKQLEIKIF